MAQMVAKLKTYNPRAGMLLQRYTYRGIRIEEGKGWYRVPSDVAEYLERVRQTDGDENSPLAFIVCTEAEAAKMQEADFRKKVSQGAVGPGDAPVMVPRETVERERAPAPAVPKAPETKPADVEWPETDMNTPRGDLTTEDLKKGTTRGGKPKK